MTQKKYEFPRFFQPLFSKFCVVVTLVLLALFVSAPVMAQSQPEKEVRVGVLMIRGVDAGRQQWQPTIDFLNTNIKDHTFKLVPFDNLEKLMAAAGNGEFEFVITNPASYVEMDVRFGASRLLTLINAHLGRPHTQFGSVIFTRADNRNINTVPDIRGKTVAAVGQNAFGGWRVALDEMHRHGVQPGELGEPLFLGTNQEKIVFAVRDGKADVGVVRTGILELMQQDGLVNMRDFRIIAMRNFESFPSVLSTDLYPEWPFARLRGVSGELSRQITDSLLHIQASDPAAVAGKYFGWSVPLNYQPVHELLRRLQVAPYQDYGKVTLSDTLYIYRHWISAIIVILIALIATGYFALLRNSQLARLQASRMADKALTELAYQKAAMDQHSIVAMTDPNGVITYVNDRFCDISGYSRDELIGNTHAIVNSGMHSKAFFDDLWKTISVGDVWRGEIINQAKDGSLYWVESTITPFRDVEGKIEKYVVIRTDVTDARKAEQALRASEELFSKAFSASPAMIAIIELVGSKVIAVNDAWLRFVGKKREDTIGKSVNELSFWIDPREREKMIGRLMRDGRVRDFEAQVWNNKREAVELLMAVDLVEFGGKQCLISVSIDMSEHNRLVATEARLGRIVESSLNEIYIFNSKTFKFQQVNNGAQRNLGYASAELMKMTPADINPDITLEQFKEMITPLRDGEVREISFETTHQRKDGTTYDASMNLHYTIDETPPVFIAFVEDVTDRKVAEESARRTQKMEAMGQLTGGIAHDFNNLLGIIIGNLDLLEEDLDRNADLKPLVETALRAAIRGSEITKRLLAVSRKTDPEMTTVNINEVLVGMESLIKRSMTPKIEVVYDLAEELWPVSINIGDFEDSVINLAVNARKAMPTGGRMVIRTLNRDSNVKHMRSGGEISQGDCILISISDTGTGIPKENISKIFDPFFTTASQSEGTGLGLSMVYGFVKRSKGKVDVESVVDEGTTFHICLPRAEEEELEDISEDGDVVLLPGGHETILVVDDEPELVKLARRTLTKLGYRVLSAANAKQAMQVIKQAGPGEIDLLFSDIVMPGDMSGLDLARAAQAENPALAVLMVTGYMDESFDSGAFSDLTQHMLNKPYNRTNLAYEVRAALNRRNFGA